MERRISTFEEFFVLREPLRELCQLDPVLYRAVL
jgi:hypothetical protein